MTRPGKAVEKSTHREADQRSPILPPLPQRLGNGLALLARFPQLHTASTIGYTNRFHPARFAGPGIERSGQPMPSSRAYSTPAPGTSNRIPAATIGNPHTRIKKKEL